MLIAPLAELLNDFLDPLIPEAVVFGTIRASWDETVRAQELAPLINAAPDYRDYIFGQTFLKERLGEWEAESKELPNKEELLLRRILGLLGKSPVRNLIACARIERLAGTLKSPQPDDKRVTVPSKLIPFALEAEKFCEDRQWIDANAAFCAGLHYDWLDALIKKRGKPSDDRRAVSAAFKEGMAVAKAAYELGQRAPEIEFSRFIFAAGLLLPIGKPVMACLFPKGGKAYSWPDFLELTERVASSGPNERQFYECRKFPVTYAEIGSLLVNFGAILRGLEKTICFFHDPQRLAQVDRGSYHLSTVLSAAAREARLGAH